MKSTLKTKLLQHFIAKKEEGGFTLIELLVVIIIIGILAAIALPSFLNQANKAKQSEATTYAGSVNRAQQAYYLERNHFSDVIGGLGLGIPVETDNYTYGDNSATPVANDLEVINAADDAVTTSPTDLNTEASGGAVVYATPKTATLLAYTGVTYILQDATTGENTTTAVLCTSNNALGAGEPLEVDASNIGEDDANVTATTPGEGTCTNE